MVGTKKGKQTLVCTGGGVVWVRLLLALRCVVVQAFTVRNRSILVFGTSGLPSPLKMQCLECLEIRDCNVSRPIESSFLVSPCSDPSPRAWLENRADGAYTVLRCEWQSFDACWLVGGENFHMNRLSHSYSTYLRSKNGERVSQSELDEAQAASQKAMRTLLQKAAQNGKLQHTIFMLTIHWTSHSIASPSSVVSLPRTIEVTAHVVSVGNSSSPQEPVRVALAWDPSSFVHSELPNRFPFPQAKLSSWCRGRRPLERTFKGDGVDEVILCDTTTTSNISSENENESVRLLEGLTSNLFALYEDGVLRTARDDGVLNGYARSLVLKHAQRWGIPIEFQAPQLHKAALWEEVFLTSSVRLVVPVSAVQLLMPCLEGDDAMVHTVVWSSSTEGRPNHISGELPLWQRLRHAMLEDGCIV